MAYSNKFAVVTLLSLILAACGGGSDSNGSTSSPNSNVFNETRFNFDFTLNSPEGSLEEPPYNVNRYSGRIDSNNVVLRTNYTKVVGSAYAPESSESYILTEKRLITKPVPAASEASSGYKDSFLISETPNTVTLAPYNNIGLHKDSAIDTLEFDTEILDGKLIADVLTNNSFGIDPKSPNLKALIASNLRFPAGSNALVTTSRSNNEDYLEFKSESIYKSTNEWDVFWKSDTVSGQLNRALLGIDSFRNFVWLGIDFNCAFSDLILNQCIVNYNGKFYFGSFNVKGSGDWAKYGDLSKRYGGFNKTAADALEDALKKLF